MTPEYIEQLADIADPERLWTTPFFEREKLTAEQRQRMDTGVALRRHAAHIRRLQELYGTGQSLLITPLSAGGHGTATATVPTPDSHTRPVTRGDR